MARKPKPATFADKVRAAASEAPLQEIAAKLGDLVLVRRHKRAVASINRTLQSTPISGASRAASTVPFPIQAPSAGRSVAARRAARRIGANRAYTDAGSFRGSQRRLRRGAGVASA